MSDSPESQLLDFGVTDRLLESLEDDISVVDPWETESSRSTLRGIGTTAGRTIMSLGTGVIRAIDYVRARRTLLRIASTQTARPSVSVPLSTDRYRDIMEFQRPGLYPQDITRGAWNLMLTELRCEQVSNVLEGLFSIPEAGHTDIQILVKQLTVCALSGWHDYPSGLHTVPLRSGAHYQTNGRSDDALMNVQFLRLLCLTVKRAHFTALREIFSPDEFFSLVGTVTSVQPPAVRANPNTNPIAYVLQCLAASWESGMDLRAQSANHALFLECAASFCSGLTSRGTAGDNEALRFLIQHHTAALTSICVVDEWIAKFFVDLGAVDLVGEYVRAARKAHRSLVQPYTQLMGALTWHDHSHLAFQALDADSRPGHFGFEIMSWGGDVVRSHYGEG
ncbi:hypothetical protein EIP91_001225 [Steccherinum ochraceum]|uniref:Uncharacterized protein n=1 Tax=Steccherinum ochraceum TaxID=92696 RepID=A0A4V2MWJ8_9APHY|nr:hypothetical protein EIP91_001225 [Steccherinum ochraceum]